MTTTFTYRDLDAWKQGMDLVEQCYKLTASFPKGEQFALTSQIRPAAVSVPSNLAEGHCRRTTKAYEKKNTIVMSDSVGRLLNGLYQSLERRLAANLESPPSNL